MAWATRVPTQPPTIWTDWARLGHGSSRRMAITRLTTGVKCAPGDGPNIVISTTRIAPVGIVLPRRATAVSLVSFAAMMPEPTTVHTSNPVPRASVIKRVLRGGMMSW